MQYKPLQARGFTLIEVMLTLVIGMVILGGLLLNFTSQSSQYKYQNKRVDAAQDLDFAMRLFERDINAALVGEQSPLVKSGGAGTTTISYDGYGTTKTTYLTFKVWDKANGASPLWRVDHCYVYNNSSSSSWMLKFKRDASPCPPVANVSSNYSFIGEEAMQVTHFRVFKDVPADATFDGRDNYTDAPAPLPPKQVKNSEDVVFNMPAFTVLVEVEIDAANKGSVTDVLGNTITNGKRRIWRYIQAYPNTIVAQ